MRTGATAPPTVREAASRSCSATPPRSRSSTWPPGSGCTRAPSRSRSSPAPSPTRSASTATPCSAAAASPPTRRGCASHITTEVVPILGTVTCNKLLFPQLEAALQDIQSAASPTRSTPSEFAGCYYPRFIAGTLDALQPRLRPGPRHQRASSNQRGTVGADRPRRRGDLPEVGLHLGRRLGLHRPDALRDGAAGRPAQSLVRRPGRPRGQRLRAREPAVGRGRLESVRERGVRHRLLRGRPQQDLSAGPVARRPRDPQRRASGLHHPARPGVRCGDRVTHGPPRVHRRDVPRAHRPLRRAECEGGALLQQLRAQLRVTPRQSPAARPHQPRRERQAVHGEQQRQGLRPGLRRRRGRRPALPGRTAGVRRQQTGAHRSATARPAPRRAGGAEPEADRAVRTDMGG